MYSPTSFSALPSIAEAHATFNDKNARKLLEGPIRQLFLKSKVGNRYAVALLHRHFPLQSTQRLVDYNNTTTAWDVADDSSDVIPKYGGLIVPRSYLFDGHGELRPYEFEFSPEANSYPSPESKGEGQFLNEFYTLLHQHGMDTVFGIRDLDGCDLAPTVEITEGFASITLPSTEPPMEDLIETTWVVNPDGVQCIQTCSGDTHHDVV